METNQNTWSSPTLLTYGGVEKITAKDKVRGGDDGSTLQPDGMPIGS